MLMKYLDTFDGNRIRSIIVERSPMLDQVRKII